MIYPYIFLNVTYLIAQNIPIFAKIPLKTKLTLAKFHLSNDVVGAYFHFMMTIWSYLEVVTFSRILFFQQIIPGNGSASFFFQIWKFGFYCNLNHKRKWKLSSDVSDSKSTIWRKNWIILNRVYERQKYFLNG